MNKCVKLISFILVSVLIFSFVGCQKEETEKSEESSTIASEDSKEEVIELTMYYPIAAGGPMTELVEKIAEDFNKENPSIKVNPVFCGSYAETMVKTQTAINGNNAPDLGVLFSIDLFTLMDMDAIEPLDNYIANSGGDEYLNDFYPAFMENGQAEGSTWGMPFQRSTIVLYYNKDAFQEVGLDPESPPTNWDEVIEYGGKLLKEENGTVSRWGIQIPSTGYQYWMHQALAIQSGKNVMNGDGTEVYFDSEESIEAMQYYYDLGSTYKVMPEGIIEWKTVPTNFIEQKTAMMIHTTGNLTNVKEKAEFDFGVAMLPANKNEGSPTGGGNFYIFKDIPDENKEAAWKFIEYATSPEVLAQWSIDTGYVAPRKSAYETEILKNYVEEFPYAIVARDQLAYANAELSTHNNGEVQQIMNDAIQAALNGTMGIEEAMIQAQTKADDILKNYR